MRITLMGIAAITALFSIFLFTTPNAWIVISSGSAAIVCGSIAAFLAKKEGHQDKASILFALIGCMVTIYRIING